VDHKGRLMWGSGDPEQSFGDTSFRDVLPPYHDYDLFVWIKLILFGDLQFMSDTQEFSPYRHTWAENQSVKLRYIVESTLSYTQSYFSRKCFVRIRPKVFSFNEHKRVPKVSAETIHLLGSERDVMISCGLVQVFGNFPGRMINSNIQL